VSGIPADLPRSSLSSHSKLRARAPPVAQSVRQLPSRQDGCKAERDAATRALAQAAAAGAAGVAAARADVNVNPLGDWTTTGQRAL